MINPILNFSVRQRSLATLATLVFAVLAASLCGCVVTKPLPTGLRVESQSAGGVKILSVRLRNTEEGLMVSGMVGRTMNYSTSSQRHLDVMMRGADEDVLQQMAIPFFPNPITYSRHSTPRSSYAVTLSVTPPSGGVVRVTVHPISFSKCQLASTAR